MKHHNGKVRTETRTKRFVVAFVSAFIAVALGLTCALCFGGSASKVTVDDVQTGSEVTTSAAKGALEGDKSGTNVLAAGDYMDYGYVNNKIYSIKLPKGKYKFEVWGAQGGSAYSNGVIGAGANGGYSVGTGVLTEAKYVYIVVGGKGTTGVLGHYGTADSQTRGYGGYNGGGNSGCEMNGDADDEGGGGGGATHIALVSGVLKNLSSAANQKNVIIVAGGGGATGWTRNANASYGAGGGMNGGNGYAGASSAGGGKTNANGTGTGGAAGRTTETGADVSHGTAGGFGYGGNGGNGTTGGGGGGGGWYGGGGTGGGGGGGTAAGGSGYTGQLAGAAVPLSDTSMTNGARTGNGMARITVVQLNDNPVTFASNGTTPTSYSGNTTSTYYKGESRNIQIRADAIARDPDPVNTSAGSTGTKNVYFTAAAANAAARDVAPSNNNHLWLDAACTKLATDYLDWSWTGGTSATTLTINKIKRLPRNGVDGCTAAGRLTLYARVRDNYYSSAQRGVSVIPFYVTVNDNGIVNITDTFKSFNKTTYEYRYGTYNLTTGGTTYNFAKNTNAIYNPANTNNTGSNRTLFISTPLTPTDKNGFTIYASDIYTDGDTHSTLGDLVAFKSLTVLSGYTGYSNYYSVTYNTDSTYATGFYPSITIKPTNVRPTSGPVFVCATITAQTSERQSKVGIGSTNTNVTLVFQIANTRPYFASTNKTGYLTQEPIITLEPNGTDYIDINKLVFDTDENSNAPTATFARGAADLKIPTNEYIQVNRVNSAVALLATSGGRSSNYNGKTSVADEPTYTGNNKSNISGEGTTPTGFKKDLVAATGSAAASTASVVYSYDSATRLRFTARASTQYQYSETGRLGDFYVLVRLVDPSDTSDNGLWYPIAIKVTSAKPTEPSTVANFSLKFNAYTAGDASKDAIQGDGEEGIVLTPISYTDANGVLRGIGTTDTSYNGGNATHANPFVLDPDTFMYDGTGLSGVEQTNALNDVVILDGTTLSAVANLYETSDFFKVELVTLHAASSVFSRLSMTEQQLKTWGVTTSGTDCTFYGLKITPKRSTNDMYFQFEVNVKDSHSSSETVRVLINVQNRAVSLRRDPNATTSYKINEMTGVGVYGENKNINAFVVNYTIVRYDTIQITPYDFAYDFDIDPANNLNNTAYNTNPKDSGFGTAVDTYIRNTYSVPYTTSVSAPAALGATSSVRGQLLEFTNTANFDANASQFSSYISATIEDKTTVKTTDETGVTVTKEYAIPCIKITGLSRTTSAVVQLRFTISDGYSSVEAIITVTVLNAAPLLNTVENHPKVNPDDLRVSEPYKMSADPTKNNYAYTFTASHAAYDKDNDTPTYVSGSVRVVAYDEDGEEQEANSDGTPNYYYEWLDKNYKGVTNKNSDGVYYLGNYVSALLTKNGSGEDILYMCGLSSTELFNKPIYVEFKVDDGFRAQPQQSTLHILVHVENSDLKVVTDGLSVRDNGEGQAKDYSWVITYDDISETALSRYIVNSKDLYESTAINVSAANKICLFDDPDQEQRVLLNPMQVVAGTGGNYRNPLVLKHTSGTKITKEDFITVGGDGYNAAIIYNPTYVGEEEGKQFLELVLHFYYKDGNTFTEYTDYTKNNLIDYKYWAIEILDHTNKTSAAATQIAIAVRDDHHNVDRYSADKNGNPTQSASEWRVFDFYYDYQMPGITNMHTYYRTDGYSESRTYLDPTNQSAGYVLDIRGFQSGENKKYQFAKDTTVPSTQSELQSATFAEDFQYQYFVKKIVKTNGADITYKYYPEETNAFYYKPIQVGGSSLSTETVVPISYLAMPSSVTGSTEGDNLHVTLANATMNTAVGTNQLNDRDFRNWGSSAATRSLVFANFTLSDGTAAGVWSGDNINDNPYITIAYRAVTTTNPNYIGDASGKYATRNTHRYTLGVQGDSSKIGLNPLTYADNNGASLYREDKYGFALAKKDGGNRAPGMLTLTVALKTSAIVTSDGTTKVVETEAEYVSVNIVLNNSSPTVYKTINNQLSSVSGYIEDISLKMTTADVSGKTVALHKYSDRTQQNLLGDYKIYYDDPDKTDTMKFLISSATGDMSTAEIDHVVGSSNSSASAVTTALNTYFNGTADADKHTYNPNPGYEKFFSISPADGAASTLQIIPVAKTEVNISDASDLQTYLDDNHLEKDSDGIYYPFRILFYDDINGSAFTDGSWTSAIIKVYIQNDRISVNKNVVKDTYKVSGSAYYGKPTYSFTLSKGADFFVNMTSLLADNDIVINEATSAYMVQTDDAWQNLLTTDIEKTYLNDCLVMPASATPTDSSIIKKPANTTAATLPVTVSYPSGSSTLPKCTLVFSANSAFKGTIDIVYTFSDSASQASTIDVVFSVTYNNEAPTPNVDTFDGADSINIVMKKGDSFTLYAADSTKFDDDKLGGFNSYYIKNGTQPASYLDGVTFPYGDTEKSAADMIDTDQAGHFLFYSASSYPETRTPGSLGSLVVGSDDAASTLRFEKYAASKDTFTGDNSFTYFTVEQVGKSYAREDNANITRPMAIKVTAGGVANTTYKVTLIDGEGVTTIVSINITVLPTAPVVKVPDEDTGLVPSTDNTKPNTFTAELEYGQELNIALNQFMYDDDRNDAAGLSVSANSDGSYFTVVNPTGVEAVTAEPGTVWGVNSVKIKANDIITDSNGVSTVSFRVQDAHGAVSETITIEITVKPANVTALTAYNKRYSVTVKSYADYIEDGQPVSVALVAAKNGVLFEDKDVAAMSANYDVTVYALLSKNTTGAYGSISETVFKALDADAKKERKLLTLDSHGLDPADNDIASYVEKFFSIEVSGDGKNMLLTPNSATIKSGNDTKLNDIILYIELTKRGGSAASTPNTGFMNVAVANSALVAVEASGINYGYPEISVGEDETILRDEEFLHFTGKAGSSLTWDLYNLDDPELGLFYDYDMIRNADGLESINYVRSSYNVTENLKGMTNKGDVLSISVSEDGKLTIKINRKVYRGTNANGLDATYTDIPVTIYCADTLGYREANRVCASTVIMVRVENDIPEIKTVTGVAAIEELGYSVTYSEVDGYVLDAKLELGGKPLRVKYSDIIRDADIDMDTYVILPTGTDKSLMGSDGYLTGSTTDPDGVNDGIGKLRGSSGETLMSVRLVNADNAYKDNGLNYIVFTCESASRGAVATCEIKFRDSVKGAETKVLTVNITVDNVAPTIKTGVSTAITIMGVSWDEAEDAASKVAQTFSILDYIDDVNGDAYDPAGDKSRTPTYVYIDDIVPYTTEDIIHKPNIYGPATELDISDPEYHLFTTACEINSFDDSYHQKFVVTPMRGVYGTQTVMLRITDSGYEDGLSQGIMDGKTYELLLTITIANPLNTVPDTLPTKNIAYGVTRTIKIEDLLGEQNAQGYEIADIKEANGGSSLTIYKPGVTAGVQTSATSAPSADNWRIYAKTEGAKVDVIVTFKAGDVTRARTLPIAVVANTAPNFINGKSSYEFTASKLDDGNKRTLKVYPEDWFEDIDDEDIMSFVGPVESSQSVKVSTLFDYDNLADGGRAYILLTFNRRGTADITFNVTDLSGRLYKKTVTVNCTDAPEMSWWESFVSIIEANWMWFWIILACILLFIILLIILIIVIHRKRKMKREIEALLNSETELEEEMLRLSAGGGMAPYQSFGYLPPTQATVNPNLMIGGGQNAPSANTLQLGAGTGAAPVGTQQVIPPANGAQQANPAAQQQQGAPVNPAQANAAQRPATPPPPQMNNDGFNPDEF